MGIHRTQLIEFVLHLLQVSLALAQLRMHCSVVGARHRMGQLLLARRVVQRRLRLWLVDLSVTISRSRDVDLFATKNERAT